jgi:hypothetical protein
VVVVVGVLVVVVVVGVLVLVVVLALELELAPELVILSQFIESQPYPINIRNNRQNRRLSNLLIAIGPPKKILIINDNN